MLNKFIMAHNPFPSTGRHTVLLQILHPNIHFLAGEKRADCVVAVTSLTPLHHTGRQYSNQQCFSYWSCSTGKCIREGLFLLLLESYCEHRWVWRLLFAVMHCGPDHWLQCFVFVHEMQVQLAVPDPSPSLHVHLHFCSFSCMVNHQQQHSPPSHNKGMCCLPLKWHNPLSTLWALGTTLTFTSSNKGASSLALAPFFLWPQLGLMRWPICLHFCYLFVFSSSYAHFLSSPSFFFKTYSW